MARHAITREAEAGDPARILARRRPSGLRLGAGALVLLLLGGLVAAVVVTLLGGTGQVSRIPESTPGPTATAGAGAVVYVHVLGAVARPGVYQFRDGDRVVDAIAAAGGYTEDADPQAVNLARFLSDGEQILVPILGAAPAPGSSTAPGADGAKINLNTATSSELEELPRIGPAMAERIIAWRDENGGFTSVDDLLGVTGIGDKTFEGLRDLVTV